MIREVDLVSYLPPFIAEYKETSVTLKAEEPEFVLIWKAAERALYNEFIVTADEYGISRFEQILNIYPSEDETLESRRQTVLLKWTAILPYTIRRLRECLSAALGDGGYILQERVQKYVIDVMLINKTDEIYYAVDRMLSGWIPMNMGYRMESRSKVDAAASKLYAGAVRAEFVRIGATPAKEDIAYLAETKINTDAMAYGVWRAFYQPKGDV